MLGDSTNEINNQTWVTNGILKSIKERDKAFHDFKKHKTEETFFHF